MSFAQMSLYCRYLPPFHALTFTPFQAIIDVIEPAKSDDGDEADDEGDDDDDDNYVTESEEEVVDEEGRKDCKIIFILKTLLGSKIFT